jgi:hypothetical protein
MEIKGISPARQAVLDEIKVKEKAGLFNESVEKDPPAPELLPTEVDYLCEKASSRLKRRIANFIADRYFLNLIKKGILIRLVRINPKALLISDGIHSRNFLMNTNVGGEFPFFPE